jgi:SagB-type dehydrogenase family enzyme
MRFFLFLITIGILSMNTTFAAVANKNGTIISLPKPIMNKDFSLDQAIEKRRSVRSFKNNDLTIEQISTLLWSAQGITDSKRGLRAAPSTGTLYPLQLYVAKSDGLWIYLPHKHALENRVGQDLRGALSDCCLHQGAIKQAPISIVVAADYDVIAKKYGDRAMRYTHIEVGHAAQNILLEATALGLAAVPMGAFDDTAVKNLLNLPKNQVALYVLSIGESM